MPYAGIAFGKVGLFISKICLLDVEQLNGAGQDFFSFAAVKAKIDSPAHI